jgi:hypothetical protein
VRVFSPHLELNNLVARGAGKSPGSNSFEEAPDKPLTSVSASQKSGQPCSV